jgi:hypothetical protein
MSGFIPPMHMFITVNLTGKPPKLRSFGKIHGYNYSAAVFSKIIPLLVNEMHLHQIVGKNLIPLTDFGSYQCLKFRSIVGRA